MPVSVEPLENAAIRLRIVGDLTIQTVAELKTPLLAAVQTNAEIDLDLSGVAVIDSAGLQVLMAAERECQQLGKPFSLTNPSAAVQDVLDLYNAIRPLNAA